MLSKILPLCLEKDLIHCRNRAFIHDNSSGNQNKKLKINELQNAATGGKNQDRTRNLVLRQMALLQSMPLEQLRKNGSTSTEKSRPSTKSNSSLSGWLIASRSFSTAGCPIRPRSIFSRPLRRTRSPLSIDASQRSGNRTRRSFPGPD